MNNTTLEGSTMARSTMAESDSIPHLPELLVAVMTCWRTIRDAQTEVDPFGHSFDALGEARAALESLAHHCTGQAGFLALAATGEAAAGCPIEDRVAAPF